MESEFRIGDLGLDEAVLIEGTEDDESNQEVITMQMAHTIGQFCGAKRSRCVAERSDVVRF